MEEAVSIQQRHMEVLRSTDAPVCKNCGASVDGKFCSVCGQDTATARFNFKGFLYDTFQFFVFKKGLMYTAKTLTLQPGVAVRQYIEGKRFHHCLPFTYLLTLLAFATLCTIYLGITAEPLFETPNHIVQMVFRGKITKIIVDFFSSYISISLLGVIPFIAGVSYYVYQKSGYNFTELLISNIYMFSHIILIYTLLTPLYLISHSFFYNLFFFLGFSYLLVSYIRFFKIDFFQGVRKFFITFFVSYLLYLMVLFLFLLIYFVYSNWNIITQQAS